MILGPVLTSHDCTGTHRQVISGLEAHWVQQNMQSKVFFQKIKLSECDTDSNERMWATFAEEGNFLLIHPYCDSS